MRSAWKVRESEMEEIRKKYMLLPFAGDLADLIVCLAYISLGCSRTKTLHNAGGLLLLAKNLLHLCTAQSHLFLIHVTHAFTLIVVTSVLLTNSSTPTSNTGRSRQRWASCQTKKGFHSLALLTSMTDGFVSRVSCLSVCRLSSFVFTSVFFFREKKTHSSCQICIGVRWKWTDD